MQGLVSEESLRRALVDSGEMDRCNVVHVSDPDQICLADAMNAAVEFHKSVPRSTHATRVVLAEELVQHVMVWLRVTETK